ncbi:hypothetical protein H072_5394 [Dactylellina haptotyla CBS 200.50]|uniref:Deacetylase sirtuin-type domain-containing protein n=1 Tax=Dactylellina haptotyla (strain CBS 200.50) TaxID=1284197 RepID=S8BMQ3_DACHA|nr:hypothetical protein H072_5394 [Dactylellina haptotyla CBS 200.50]
MDDQEPPSKRRKVDSPSDAEPAETTPAETPGSKSLETFAVEIVVGSGSSTPAACGGSSNKQKQSTPKERSTERIDVNRIHSQLVDKQLSTWLDILNKKKKIIVIAGAGISVCAGIPDFRSSNGLFASVKSDYKLKASGKQLFDASVYKDDKSTSDFHDMVRNLYSMSTEAQPTSFHHLLASLATSGRLLRLYTQNVDCIETSLAPLASKTPLNNKGPWPKTIQLHGGLDKMNCSKCRVIKEFIPDIFVGPTPPDCPDCVDWEAARDASGKRSQGIGKLRPRMVLYNEHNPDQDAIGAVSTADLRARPDCLIVVGTSLKIPGVQRLVRELCASIRDFRGGKTVWINRDEPPATGQMKGLFDLVLKGDCETLAKLSNVKHHDQFTPDTDLKKITGTGMELGVSTPISMDSESDSPLSSPVSYASSEEIWENMKNNRPVDIPWPQAKFTMPTEPLSPSASPHPKKVTLSKAGTKTAKAKTLSTPTKAKPGKDATKQRKKPGPKPKPKDQNVAISQKGKLTKAFKASKKEPQVSKAKKADAISKPAVTAVIKPEPLAMSTPPAKKPEAKLMRVNVETLKRKLESQIAAAAAAANSSPPVLQTPKLVLHGSDTSFSSLTDISSTQSSPTSTFSLKGGLSISDLLS